MPVTTMQGLKYSDLKNFPLHLLIGPVPSAVKVTKSDIADLPGGTCRALWVGTAGTANLVLHDGTTVADFPLQKGMNPFFVTRVKLLGTADDIWACY